MLRKVFPLYSSLSASSYTDLDFLKLEVWRIALPMYARAVTNNNIELFYFRVFFSSKGQVRV